MKELFKQALKDLEAAEACEDCPFEDEECHDCKYAQVNP